MLNLLVAISIMDAQIFLMQYMPRIVELLFGIIMIYILAYLLLQFLVVSSWGHIKKMVQFILKIPVVYGKRLLLQSADLNLPHLVLIPIH